MGFEILGGVGGGPVDEATGKYVKADHVCKNAQQTVEYCKSIWVKQIKSPRESRGIP